MADDISPGYFSHEPSLSEAASRFPTFADCKNHIKVRVAKTDFESFVHQPALSRRHVSGKHNWQTLSMRVLKDFHTLGAREPAGEAAGEAQASGETSEAKAEDIGERELLMQVGGWQEQMLGDRRCEQSLNQITSRSEEGNWDYA